MPAALTLPVIDISPYIPSHLLSPSYQPSTSHPAPIESQTSSAIHTACRDIGFFYLNVSSYLSPTDLSRVLELGKEFFDLPLQEKVKIKLGNQFGGEKEGDSARGYQGVGVNVTGGKRDWHEGVDFYSEGEGPYEVDDPERGSRILGGTNQWPERPAAFRPTMEDWVEKMKILGEIVMKAMADGLGLTEDEWQELRGMVDDSYWVMRVIGYPPLPVDAEGISCGAHKDYGCITFLHADSTPKALQVFLRPTPIPGEPARPESEGVWIDADPREGCVVVNVGEMWEIWTNGLYKSTLHQVIHRSPTYRVSLPFFFEPNFNAQVKPLAGALRKQKEEGWVGGRGGKEYGEVKYGDFLLGKVGGNFVKEGGEKKGRY